MERYHILFIFRNLYCFKDERATAAQCLQHDFLKPFGGKPPPVDCPVEVFCVLFCTFCEVKNVLQLLARLYPDGNIPRHSEQVDSKDDSVGAKEFKRESPEMEHEIPEIKQESIAAEV